MTTQTKRKRSYGLISRLVVIATFVGLGSWAVLNSKFRGPSEQIAKVESEDDKKRDEGGTASEEDQAEPGSKAEKSDLVKASSKIDDIKKNGPPNPSSFSPASTSKNVTGNPTIKNKIVGNIDDSSTNIRPNSFLSKFGNENRSKPAKKDPIDGSIVRPASLKIPDDSKDSFKSAAKTSSPPPSKTPPPTKAPTTGPPDTKPPSSLPSNDFAAKSSKASGGFTPPTKSFNPNPSDRTSTENKEPAKSKTPDSTPPKRLISNSSNAPPSTFNPSGAAGSKPSDPIGGGATKNKTAATAPPSTSAFSATNNFKEVKNEKPLRSSKMESKSGPPKSSKQNLASGSTQNKGFDPNPSTAPNPSTQFAGSTLNNPASSGGSGFNPTNRNSGGGFSLSPNPASPNTSGNTPPSNAGNSLANSTRPPSIPNPKRTSPAFSEKGGNKTKSEKSSTSPPVNGISVRPIASDDTRNPGSSSGSAFGSRPNANTSQTLTAQPSKAGSIAPTAGPPTGSPRPTQDGSTPQPGGNKTQKSFASSSKPISSNPNLNSNPTVGVGDNKPGPNTLEGTQTPAITLRKVAPPEVQLNVEATFKIIVKNVGKTPATNVTIVDPIPVGTEFVSSVPRHSDTGTDGSLIWKFGSLAPNETKVISVNLKPVAQGEIGSVARMSFQAAATAKTVCTKPVLQITQRGPEKVLIGQNAQFQINVKNTGDGRAINVSIQEIVPKGFAFADIRNDTLVYEIGNLAPQQSRNVNLTLRAVTPGKYACKIDARMGKTLASSKTHNIEIIAPVLAMKINGPERRYIQREAKYKIDLENTGTAVAQNVNMITYLPKGMRFISTNNRGQYVQRQHAVYWSIATLAPGNKGSVELRLMPVGTGQQEIRYEARSVLAKTELSKHKVLIDQLAELFFEVDDRDDPIEVNGETEYRVRVVNQGTKMATNVSVVAEMPAGINAFDGSGPTKPTIAGRMVSFAPIAQLAPEGVAIFKIQAKGVSDGDHKIRISLSSNERRESVAKEESTKVYSSQIR